MVDIFLTGDRSLNPVLAASIAAQSILQLAPCPRIRRSAGQQPPQPRSTA